MSTRLFLAETRSLSRNCRLSLLLLGLACVVPAACGSSASNAADGGGTLAACPGPAAEDTSDPTKLFDDFEDGNSQIAIVAGRTGTWFSYGDTTAAGKIEPLGDSPPELIPGGRAKSLRALHITSTGFLDWGSGISAAAHYGTDAAGVSGLQAYDAKAYKGVTFYARVGDTSTATVRIQFNDQYTRPEGGMCVPNGPTGQACYDGFGIDIPNLSTTWQFYRIPFAGLSQRGFGVPRDALDTSTFYELALAFLPRVVTDFWIDDIRFF